jgi:conjugal transfer pilus assembly protein TraB
MWHGIWKKITVQEGDSALTAARKQTYLKWGLGTGGVCLIFLLQSGLQKVSTPILREDKPKKVVLGDLVDAQDVWAARLEKEAAAMREQGENIKKNYDLQEKRLKLLEEAFLAKPDAFSQTQEEVQPLEEGNPSVPPSFPGDIPTYPPASRDFSDPAEKPISAPSLLKTKKLVHLTAGVSLAPSIASYVVSGSYARAVLTSGVVVSTATATPQNPQPIVLRLSEGGTMPRGWKSALKDGVIIGSCYGDLSSERAICRLHKLSLIEKGGRLIERSVEGWIIGEDGAPGMRGKVVDKAGAVAREAFLSGILSGMSNFLKFDAQTSVYPVSPFGQTRALSPQEALKGGVGQGASSALEKLAEFSIKRAESMAPVIVVNPGRVVDVVFKEGFDLRAISDESLTQKPQPSSQKPGGLHD